MNTVIRLINDLWFRFGLPEIGVTPHLPIPILAIRHGRFSRPIGYAATVADADRLFDRECLKPAVWRTVVIWPNP